MRYWIFLVFLAVHGVFSIGAASAQVAVSPDWQVNCEAEGCLVVKSVAAADGKRLMSLTFAVSKAQGTIRMAVLTPLGTALDPGLRLAYGTTEQTYRFTTCMPDGCAILVDMAPDTIANLEVQPSMTISFFAVNREQPYEVTIELDEMSEAISTARNELQE